MRVLMNSREFLKTAFREHPFMMWSVIYLWIITFLWQYVSTIMRVFGMGWVMLTLLLFPVGLWIYTALGDKEKERKKIKNFHGSKRLTTQQLAYLKERLPISQLNFFEEVLMVSLNIIHAALDAYKCDINAQSTSKQQTNQLSTLFDKRFKTICQAFERLNKIPELYSGKQHLKSRDCAITAFVFYRIAYRDITQIIQELLKSTVSKSVLDEWVLLKRLPLKLQNYLGAQFWRLYEFKQMVYGDLSSLELNRDIAEIIAQGCDDPLSSGVMDNAPIAEQAKQQYLESSLLTAKESTQPASETVEKVEYFISWLENKINGQDNNYHSNAGKFVFSESLRFGDTVFVTEQLLNKYQTVCHVHPNKLKEALAEHQSENKQSYNLSQKDKQIQLIRINHIKVHNTVPLSGKIIEER